MKTFSKFFGIILLSSVVFFSCQENTSDSSLVSSDQGSLLKGSGPSASGQGSITDGNWRIFTFHAVTHPNGSVSGNGVLKRNPGGAKFQFDIDCLSVDGNVAIMSGTITKLPLAPEFEGQPFWFKVVDNGEGVNAPPDEITFFYYCPPDDPECVTDLGDCGIDHPENNLVPIEAGNIQVTQ